MFQGRLPANLFDKLPISNSWFAVQLFTNLHHKICTKLSESTATTQASVEVSLSLPGTLPLRKHGNDLSEFAAAKNETMIPTF
jgi:hypothetical protein